MNTLREKQMLEALERMAILNLHPNVITEFTTEQKLNKSFVRVGRKSPIYAGRKSPIAAELKSPI